MNTPASPRLDPLVSSLPNDIRYVTAREFFLEYANSKDAKLILRIASAIDSYWQLSLKSFSAHGNLIAEQTDLQQDKDYSLRSQKSSIPRIANLEVASISTIVLEPKQHPGISYFILQIKSNQPFSLRLDRIKVGTFATIGSKSLASYALWKSRQAGIMLLRRLPFMVFQNMAPVRMLLPVKSVCAKVVSGEEPVVTIIKSTKYGRLRFRTTQGITGLVALYSCYDREGSLKQPELTTNSCYSSSEHSNYFFIPRARKLNRPEFMMKSIDIGENCMLFQVRFKTLSDTGNYLDLLPMYFLREEEPEQKMVNLFDDLILDVIDKR
jgi:hypothetical protein